MPAYTPTLSQIFDPSYWAAVNLTTGVAGDVIDLSALTPAYGVTGDINSGYLTFTGPNPANPGQSITFTVAGQNYTGTTPAPDAMLGNDAADIFFNVETWNFGAATVDLRSNAQATTLTLGSGNDTLTGGNQGADTVYGGGGNDWLQTSNLADSVYGGLGNDTLDGRSGADVLYGGDGDDKFLLSNSFGNDTIYASDMSETVGDIIDATAVTGAGVTITVSNSIGTITQGSDTVTFYAIERIRMTNQADSYNGTAVTGWMSLWGEDGDDTILAGTGGDIIFGGGGSDSLDGKAGNDTIAGDTGNDTLLGDAGNDTLSGGEGEDRLSGGSASDHLTGDGGADTLDGQAGTDSLFGGAGNDSLNGGTGNDQLEGGDDADTFAVNSNTDQDTVIGGEGGIDNDTLILGDGTYTDGVTVVFTGNEAGTADFDNPAATGTATFSQIEVVGTTPYNDLIDASATTSGIELGGGEGNDSVIGGSGADSLGGQDGADTIRGRAGDDTIAGGTGNDLFVLEDAGGGDVIADFSAPIDNGNSTFTGQDLFDVSLLTDASGNPVNTWDVTVTDTIGDGSGDAILTFPDGTFVTLSGVSPAQVSSPAQMNAMGIPCFVRGTLISTLHGAVAIEDLSLGDMVLTVDNGYKPILWIGSRQVDGTGPLAPIRFEVGVLMNERPLWVSPQHRVQVKSTIAAKMLGSQDVLVAAKHLLGLPGVSQTPVAKVEYFHFLFDQHELVRSEGAVTESLYTGPEAMKALEPDARSEILAIFPDLANIDYSSLCRPARPLVSGRLGRQLATRHQRNNKRLVF